jgi:hypothetical protein
VLRPSVRTINDQVSDPSKADDMRTKLMIDRVLNFASLSDNSDKADFTLNAQRAFKELLDLRNGTEKLSQSIPLRNAEYYVLGYFSGLDGDPILSAGIDFGDIYEIAKWLAQKTKATERLMRSNPEIPTSPAGGAEWAKAGLLDGRLLRDGWVSTPAAKMRTRNYP